MDGLIIKKEWLDLILSGKKTLEIRGSGTNKIGQKIYLLESGSRKIRGTCKIFATYQISCSDWHEESDKHCVNMSYKELKEIYEKPTAWELTEVETIEEELYYKHPKGAVIWVKDVEPITNWKEDFKRKLKAGEFSTDSDIFDFADKYGIEDYGEVIHYLNTIQTIGTPCEKCKHIEFRYSMYPCNICRKRPGLKDMYEPE